MISTIKILTNLEDSVFVNRERISIIELASEKYVVESLGSSTILTFNQTLQIYLKVFVGNDTYDLTKYDRIQTTDTTLIKSSNTGRYLLQQWNIKCNDKNNNSKIQNFIKSTETTSASSHPRATSLSPIGDSFM